MMTTCSCRKGSCKEEGSEFFSVMANGVKRGNSHQLGCGTVRMDTGEIFLLEGLRVPGAGIRRGRGSHPYHLAR